LKTIQIIIHKTSLKEKRQFFNKEKSIEYKINFSDIKNTQKNPYIDKNNKFVKIKKHIGKNIRIFL